MRNQHYQPFATIARRTSSALFAALIAFFVFQTAHAQVPTGAISGTVKDASGAVVAGANVTATNRDTGLNRSVQTGPDGHFKLNAVPAGNYDAKTDMPGFTPQFQQNLKL